jgi:hypothetical protein
MHIRARIRVLAGTIYFLSWLYCLLGSGFDIVFLFKKITIGFAEWYVSQVVLSLGLSLVYRFAE